MNCIPQARLLADYIDIIDTALAPLSRRLPVKVSREDLASVGKLALIAALNLAQGSTGEVRAYCFVRVRGAMFDELRRLDPLPRGRRDKFTAIMRAQVELASRLGREATRGEIAAASKCSLVEVASALAHAAAESEFTDQVLELVPDTETPSPAENVESEDLRLNLRGALSRLGTAQAAVLYRYYFDDATLESIAAELDVSIERVRQIRQAAEKKLRADFAVLAIWQTLLDRD